MSGGRRTRIKFCGMTRETDVVAATELGIDAIGLIFAERSPRRLDAAAGRALRVALPPFVTVVALVMDPEPVPLRTIVDIVRPHLLQFHGSESPEDCARAGLPYLKAIPMAIPEAPASSHARRYATLPGSGQRSTASTNASGGRYRCAAT